MFMPIIPPKMEEKIKHKNFMIKKLSFNSFLKSLKRTMIKRKNAPDVRPLNHPFLFSKRLEITPKIRNKKIPIINDAINCPFEDSTIA